MHIIQTHDQADFDALAAMLGAYLLRDHAIPVLPRRLNRNVSAFLTLYSEELPFIDARDLPDKNINSVTLVDTQSLVTLKGMTKKTIIHVVDHHQTKSAFPPNWTISNETVGACTTLFVEELSEHNGKLSLIQATLLLLGIHEDTGSFSYPSTTARDVKAAAYLLEHGASLRIANKFLNPPLSTEQQAVYDQFLSNANTYHIKGQQVIISTANAEALQEELSSVAHKFRDLIEPSALFLLAKTKEGIRLIARSTTDRINVADIASYFGGGGHEQASAALINVDDQTRDVIIEKIKKELLDIIPDHISPAISVKKIMSEKPMVLSPENLAKDASELMKRYGYEGYPVIENGNIIGLLTRRAVDRSLSHKLNLPVKSLMDAGTVSVKPTDSIEHLQQIMINSGWGQIPVTDTSNKVIGIVTRTDLINSLAGKENNIPGKMNLAQKLEAALPPARIALLQTIAVEAKKKTSPVYIVGGFVRDLLLDRPSIDFDIVVEGDAIELGKILVKRLGGRITKHNRFGTAKWNIAEIKADLINTFSYHDKYDPVDLPDSLDLISARMEFYKYPSALPSVEQGSIKLDLHRRDFTINTMAIRLDGRHYGELYDYWGGLNDLKNGIIRVLHSLSFIDDPTRMLRAVRFEQRFKFRIESRTLELMDEAYQLLSQISGERLRHEFNLILDEENPSEMFRRFNELGLLTAIHPELKWSENIEKSLNTIQNQEIEQGWKLPKTFGQLPIKKALAYLVWLGNLPPSSVESIARQLRFPKSFIRTIVKLAELWQDIEILPQMPVSNIVARFDDTPPASLYVFFIACDSEKIRDIISNYKNSWQYIKSNIDGKYLYSNGIKPGPIYKLILSSLRNAWLDNKIRSVEEEKELFEYLKNKYNQ